MPLTFNEGGESDRPEFEGTQFSVLLPNHLNQRCWTEPNWVENQSLLFKPNCVLGYCRVMDPFHLAYVDVKGMLLGEI